MALTMSFLSEIFSNRIRAIRLERGLSQAEAAELMKTDPANVSRWESGKYLPSEEALKAIAEAYEIRPENFLGPEMERNALLSRIITLLPSLQNSELRAILKRVEDAPSRSAKDTSVIPG